MDFKHLFLSFDGRVRRLHFWIGVIILWVIESVVNGIFAGGLFAAAASGDRAALMAAVGTAAPILCVVALVMLWPTLAIWVKRCHDRNKSGWWLVLMWLASLTIIGVLWPLIELGFMDGTPGPNRFGPSPKGLGGDAPAPAAA